MLGHEKGNWFLDWPRRATSFHFKIQFRRGMAITERPRISFQPSSSACTTASMHIAALKAANYTRKYQYPAASVDSTHHLTGSPSTCSTFFFSSKFIASICVCVCVACFPNRDVNTTPPLADVTRVWTRRARAFSVLRTKCCQFNFSTSTAF